MRKAENVETLRRIANRENRKFDDLVKERTADEILALKKKWGTSDDLFEAEPRIKEIASDLVGHYIANILPNGFKAQVVCSLEVGSRAVQEVHRRGRGRAAGSRGRQTDLGGQARRPRRGSASQLSG